MNLPPLNILALCLCGILLAFTVTPAFAKSEIAEASPSPVPAVHSIENLGLYVRTSQGSLGPDLWKNARRSEITKMLQDMPGNHPSGAVQNLILGVLLTQNDGQIANDIPLDPGEDIFTLRLKKLIASGFYKQAAALYRMIDEEPYHENLAYQGTLAMLFDGDKSSGCIEARAAAQTFADDTLFNNIIEYCAAPENPAPAIYDARIFKEYSLEKLAMIAAEGPLDTAHLKKKQIQEIPPTQIALLLRSKTLSEENEFYLKIQAKRWGLLTVDDLQDYYASLADALGPAPASGWQKIPQSYIQINAGAESQRWPHLRNILALEKIYGTAAMLPFAEMLYEAKPLDINYDEIVSAARVLIRAGYKLPAQWIEIIRESVSPQTIRPYDSRLLAVSYLSENPAQRNVENIKKLAEILKSQKNKDNFLVNYVIENIDKSERKVNNDLRVYEKEYRLTFDQDYVMPSEYVWHRLKDVSQESNIGETVLLSTLALGDKTLPELHPDVLITIVRDLEKVGLTDTAGRLAGAYLIGGTIKGEN